MSSLTLADKIAWMLRKGIEVSIDSGKWVLNLMRKIMQALCIRVVKTAKELTQAFMRHVLQRLLTRMAEEAMKAIRGLTSKN